MGKPWRKHLHEGLSDRLAEPAFRQGCVHHYERSTNPTDQDMATIVSELRDIGTWLVHTKHPHQTALNVREALDRFAEVPTHESWEGAPYASLARYMDDYVVRVGKRIQSEEYYLTDALRELAQDFTKTATLRVLWKGFLTNARIDRFWSENARLFSSQFASMSFGDALQSTPFPNNLALVLKPSSSDQGSQPSLDEDLLCFLNLTKAYAKKVMTNRTSTLLIREAKLIVRNPVSSGQKDDAKDDGIDSAPASAGAYEMDLLAFSPEDWANYLTRFVEDEQFSTSSSKKNTSLTDEKISQLICFGSFMYQFSEVGVFADLKYPHAVLNHFFDGGLYQDPEGELALDDKWQQGVDHREQLRRYFYLAWAMASRELREEIVNEVGLAKFCNAVLGLDKPVGSRLRHTFNKQLWGEPGKGAPGRLFTLLPEMFGEDR